MLKLLIMLLVTSGLHLIHVRSMGLYIVCGDSTQLVAGGKVFGVGGTIHTVAYGDDVLRVCVDTVYDGEAIVPLPTSEIQYVRDTMNSFIGWSRHLVKPLSYVSNIIIPLPNCHLNTYL